MPDVASVVVMVTVLVVVNVFGAELQEFVLAVVEFAVELVLDDVVVVAICVVVVVVAIYVAAVVVVAIFVVAVDVAPKFVFVAVAAPVFAIEMALL